MKEDQVTDNPVLADLALALELQVLSEKLAESSLRENLSMEDTLQDGLKDK
jgi:hypothetical protein